MKNRTVEIDDTLKERTETAIEVVKDALLDYLKENPDHGGTPCLNNDLDHNGTIHEIVDGSVPIHTKAINDTWYLYSNELERAYHNAGVGDNPRENYGMAAIYFYIDEEVREWYYNNADEIVEEWREKQEKTTV